MLVRRLLVLSLFWGIVAQSANHDVPSQIRCAGLLRQSLESSSSQNHGVPLAAKSASHLPTQVVAWLDSKYRDSRSLRLMELARGASISGNTLSYDLRSQIPLDAAPAYGRFVGEFSEFVAHRVGLLKRVEGVTNVDVYELELSSFYVLQPLQRVLERSQVLSYLLIEFIGLKNSSVPDLFEKTMQLKRLVFEPMFDPGSFQGWLEGVASKNPSISVTQSLRAQVANARRHLNEAFTAQRLAAAGSFASGEKPRVFFAPEFSRLFTQDQATAPSFDFAIRTSQRTILGAGGVEKNYAATFVEIKEVGELGSLVGDQRPLKLSQSEIGTLVHRTIGSVIQFKANGRVLTASPKNSVSSGTPGLEADLLWRDLDAKLMLLVRIPWEWGGLTSFLPASGRAEVQMDYLGDCVFSTKNLRFRGSTKLSNFFVRLAEKTFRTHGVDAPLNAVLITDYNTTPLAMIRMRGAGEVVLRDGRLFRWDSNFSNFIQVRGSQPSFSFDRVEF